MINMPAQTRLIDSIEALLIINPKKKGIGGRRYYSSSDIEVLILIKGLLYTEGFTIKGAVNFINEKYKKNNTTSKKQNVKLVFRVGSRPERAVFFV